MLEMSYTTVSKTQTISCLHTFYSLATLHPNFCNGLPVIKMDSNGTTRMESNEVT